MCTKVVLRQVKRNRQIRCRWKLASKLIGVIFSDIQRSQTLHDFILSDKPYTRKIPPQIMAKIQRELWEKLYTAPTRPQDTKQPNGHT